MQTIVIYSSQTGNTRKLATQIFAAIPGDSKDLKNIDEYREKDAELYFVGSFGRGGNSVRNAWRGFVFGRGIYGVRAGFCRGRDDRRYRYRTDCRRVRKARLLNTFFVFRRVLRDYAARFVVCLIFSLFLLDFFMCGTP